MEFIHVTLLVLYLFSTAMHHASNWIESVRASDTDINIHAAMDNKGKKLPRLAPVRVPGTSTGTL